MSFCCIVYCRDDDGIDQKSKTDNGTNGGGAQTAGTLASANSLLDSSQTIAAIEYKKGYMMRKCCFEANKKSKLGTIGFGVVLWLFRMFCLVLYNMELVLCRVCILWADDYEHNVL